jgi:DNA polymerase III psi subunit
MSQNDYLNAMGISTWVVRDDEAQEASASQQINQTPANEASSTASSTASPKKVRTEATESSEATGIWSFVMDDLSGDASLLFDKMLASLMLTRQAVQILTSQEARAGKVNGQVVVAMGSSMTRQLLQLDEGFEESRGAVHSLELGDNEWPVVLTYHPEHLLKQPKDKAKAWQDLLLARSLI